MPRAAARFEWDLSTEPVCTLQGAPAAQVLGGGAGCRQAPVRPATLLQEVAPLKGLVAQPVLTHLR